MKTKIPTFKEWIVYHEGWLKNLGATAAVASLGYGAAKMNQAAPKSPPALVTKMNQAVPKNPPALAAKQQQAGQNFKMTIERPAPNIWRFNIIGKIKPRDAIKQAKDIVQNELGRQDGISADFNPTDDGMIVTVNFTPATARITIDD